jgi:hypothetical protein
LALQSRQGVFRADEARATSIVGYGLNGGVRAFLGELPRANFGRYRKLSHFFQVLRVAAVLFVSLGFRVDSRRMCGFDCVNNVFSA